MKYIVTTSCTAITDYLVEAKSAADAEEQFNDGNFLSEHITDYQNEELISIDLEADDE